MVTLNTNLQAVAVNVTGHKSNTLCYVVVAIILFYFGWGGGGGGCVGFLWGFRGFFTTL